jgi:hypothetical protein
MPDKYLYQEAGLYDYLMHEMDDWGKEDYENWYDDAQWCDCPECARQKFLVQYYWLELRLERLRNGILA